MRSGASVFLQQPISMLLLLLVVLLLMATTSESAESPPQCVNQTCGSISNISYPFTLTINNASCPGHPSNHSYFQLFCNETSQSLYMLPDPTIYPNVPLTTLQVTAILNDSLIVNFTDFIVVMEPSPNGNFSNCSHSDDKFVVFPPIGEGPYLVSDDNDFCSFGCSRGFLYTANVVALDYNHSFLLSNKDQVSVGGCAVVLPDDERNERCGNHTCCVASFPPASDVPSRVAEFAVDYSTSFLFSQTDPNCSCDKNYATIFHPNYTDFTTLSFGVKIKWALPAAPQYFNSSLLKLNGTPPQFTNLVRSSPNYACDSNATAIPVKEIQGYLCSCHPGFSGDGYAQGRGCSDVDECADPSLNRCVPESTCSNTVGNYTCDCNSWYLVGDGRSDGTGSRLSPSTLKVIVGVSSLMGFLLIITAIIMFLALWMKRMKRRNFVINGGLELQEYMKKADHNTARIFTEDELKVATNKYAENMKIGTGGFGAVYKGKLNDGKMIAIKKSIKLENGDNGQFFNEITILTRLNHKHIVRLLGCCLESKAPILVYEFVPNGTLAENLERKDGAIMMWEQRLKVAIQTSEALAFLHRVASPPILHRDVKSANVLLDENWDVKVADFGVSRLVPDGVDHVSTVVQGTLGYLDPEYFQTLQLTDKSDVYSFGVLLVELITTLKPVDSHNREPQFSNLALLFIHHVKEGRIEEIIDPRLEIVTHQISPHDVDWVWKVKSSILSVASLAHRCLAIMGHDRPTMAEVEHELHRIFEVLYAMNEEVIDEESSLMVGAVTIKNDNYVVQSSGSYSDASISQYKRFHVSTLGR